MASFLRSLVEAGRSTLDAVPGDDRVPEVVHRDSWGGVVVDDEEAVDEVVVDEATPSPWHTAQRVTIVADEPAAQAASADPPPVRPPSTKPTPAKPPFTESPHA